MEHQEAKAAGKGELRGEGAPPEMNEDDLEDGDFRLSFFFFIIIILCLFFLFFKISKTLSSNYTYILKIIIIYI